MRWAWMVVLAVVLGCSGGITTTTDERARLAGAGDGEAGAGAGGASSSGASSAAAGEGGAEPEVGGAPAAGVGGIGLGGDATTGGAPTGGALPSSGGAPGGAGAHAGGAGILGGASATRGAPGGAGGVLSSGGTAGDAGGDGGAGGCWLVERIPWQDLELGSCCCCGATCDRFHGFCEDGVTDTIALAAPALTAGAVVVEAWTSVAVDETQPDTWPRLWVEGFEGDRKPVAGLPASRLWFDVGEVAPGSLTLRADQINGLDDTERDLNVDAVEFWECAP